MKLQDLVQQMQSHLAWIPAWAFSLGLMAAAVLVAIAAHEAVVRLVRRGLTHQPADAFWRPLLVRTRAPGRLALIVLALNAASHVAPLTPRQASLAQHLLVIAFIMLVGWAVLTAVQLSSALYLRRYRIDVSDNLLARKHLTQVRILQRAVSVLVVVLTLGLALMTIDQVREWGVSLLAAGGAAGIVVGLALQPMLTNLIAGIQIATTQPIRIDDQVLVENEVGNVEEINATYVVVRLWDERRLVLPLTYFLQTPFQNWTRASAQLTGAVMLYLDYTTPIAPLRSKLYELLEASPLWDRRVKALQVTDAKERTMEVRCLMSAANSGALFDLRCEVRETLIAWLRANYPNALPRERLELAADFGARREGWRPDEDPARPQ